MDQQRLRDQFGSHMVRLSRLWRTRLDERLSPLGLTQARWTILLHLHRGGGHLPQKALVERVGVEGPTLVRVLDGLERMHLIERHDCQNDRRTKTVHLTAAAEPIITDIIAIAADLRAEVLDGVTDEELATCAAILSRIAHNLGEDFWDDLP
ncbi:MAG: transcriptional regulator SlyA [Telmatospirillum sp.]|nr:transcriptional regulator SlyA [Telmatospirillum sp.]